MTFEQVMMTKIWSLEDWYHWQEQQIWKSGKIMKMEKNKSQTCFWIVQVSVKWSEVKFLSHVRLFATPWTAAYQAPPSMGFSRQEYWSGLPFPSPGDLPDPGIKPGSPAFQADALTSEPPGKPIQVSVQLYNNPRGREERGSWRPLFLSPSELREDKSSARLDSYNT